jgi:hypothetical protein
MRIFWWGEAPERPTAPLDLGNYLVDSINYLFAV